MKSRVKRAANMHLPGGRGHPFKHVFIDFAQPIHYPGG